MEKTTIFDLPADRHYDRETHMWAQYDPAEARVTVGIDTLGLDALGELAYISLASAGQSVRRGESMGTLEAAKMTDQLFAPISGSIVTRNEAALRNPGLVNDAPYGAGWLVIIEPDDWESEARLLVSGDELPDWVEAEIDRYRAQGQVD